MNKLCPNCSASYNITANHVGHTFACKRCNTPLVVLADGIHAASSQAPQPFTQDDDFTGPASRRYTRRPSAFVDYLLFRRMIVPFFIQIFFWIMLILTLVGGVLTLLSGFSDRPEATTNLLAGITGLVVGPFVLRIICEWVIVIFRMNESLRDLIDELRRRP